MTGSNFHGIVCQKIYVSLGIFLKNNVCHLQPFTTHENSANELFLHVP